MPFIFKHEDIQRLLSATDDLRDTSNAHRRSAIWRMMIMLGYGLGMRIGEICNLQVGDIDLERNVLLIANSKFGKSRYLPMGPKIAERLALYLADSVIGNESQRVFRWREDRQAIHSCNTWRTFRHLTSVLNLHAGPGQREPRFHDLRHSFAVNTLLRFYQNGEDPAQHLLPLSTFMGHSEIQHTAVYLTITDALLNEANSRFQKLAMKALQEVQL
ncbi:MAG: tyrosine-type recombinase/integrase [Candidatus Obscuribacterales bacterium]|nr:tyrosine-type recombinase/integrase [Candidatus Obscuribacterales bacterium]